MNQKCPERERLVEQYTASVNAYGRTVREIRSGAAREMRQLTQQKSALCQQALQAVLDHEREHHCGKAIGKIEGMESQNQDKGSQL